MKRFIHFMNAGVKRERNARGWSEPAAASLVSHSACPSSGGISKSLLHGHISPPQMEDKYLWRPERAGPRPCFCSSAVAPGHKAPLVCGAGFRRGNVPLFKQKECVLASVAGISFLTPDGARHVKTSGACCSRSLSETVALVSQGARITRTRKDVRSRCCLARPVVPGVYAWLESDPVPWVPLLLPTHSCWQSGRVCMCRPPCTSVWFMSSGEHLRTGQVQAQAPALSRGWLGFLAQQ